MQSNFKLIPKFSFFPYWLIQEPQLRQVLFWLQLLELEVEYYVP